MQGNDLSNAPFPRILVNSEVLTIRTNVPKKILGMIPVVEEEQYLDVMVTNLLNNYGRRHSVNFEAFGFGEQDQLDGWFEYIDSLGFNPFISVSAYRDLSDLMTQVLFRPEVIGILDFPSHMLRYGSYALDFDKIR